MSAKEDSERPAWAKCGQWPYCPCSRECSEERHDAADRENDRRRDDARTEGRDAS